MRRLLHIDPADAEGDARAMLSGVKAKQGRVPNTYRVMASAPAALDGFLAMDGALANGRLNAETRESISLTVAAACGCDYTATVHASILRGLGVDGDEIDRRLSGGSINTKLGAILAFARSVVESRGHVRDAEVESLRTSGYADGDIVETLANVALTTLMAFVNAVADTEPDLPCIDTSPHKL